MSGTKLMVAQALDRLHEGPPLPVHNIPCKKDLGKGHTLTGMI